MISHLYIKNFALIEELDIDLHEGFSVITGETGAGKSIILGALGLLLGNRADTKAIKEGASKCIVEARFSPSTDNIETLLSENDIDSDDDGYILRREISASGKSRSFINDSPVSLQLMREVGHWLVDIHSQHQNLLLKTGTFQLSVIDTIAGNQQLLADCSESYNAYSKALQTLEDTRRTIEESRQNLDFIRFQYEELSRMNLQPGEDEELEKQSSAMQHAEDIKAALFEIDSNMGDENTGILVLMHRSLSALYSIADFLPNATGARERLDSAYIELKDLSADISDMLSEADYNPDEMERVTSRLDAIYTLEKKHHVETTGELLQLQARLGEQIDHSEDSEAVISQLEKAVAEKEKLCRQHAALLHGRREKAVAEIERDMQRRLAPLGLPNVKFAVQISEKALSADGTDKAEFLFSANPGTPLRPVSEVASGGEIARVMLSLKASLSAQTQLPTIVFDEIDTGVSGKVAEQMALTMREMADAGRQVISITHLPQIAARGSRHYKVFKQQDKDTTQTLMTSLSQEERITEIAQMLSGNNVSEAAISNAKELLRLQQ